MCRRVGRAEPAHPAVRGDPPLAQRGVVHRGHQRLGLHQVAAPVAELRGGVLPTQLMHEVSSVKIARPFAGN